MSDCIFCKIVSGKIPSHKLYEDDDFFALLDIRPLSKGHALIIPKKHIEWVHETKPFGEYWKVAHKITKGLIKGLDADHVNYVTLGYAVNHAHIHVIPRYPNDDLGEYIDWKNAKEFSSKEMDEIAGKIRKNIKK